MTKTQTRRLLLSLLLLLPTLGQGLRAQPLGTDTVPSTRQGADGLLLQGVVKSLPIVSAGLLQTLNNRYVRELRFAYYPRFRHHYDDYLQFAPLAGQLGLRLVGVRGVTESPLQMVTADALASLSMLAITSAIKYTADPDSKLPEITYWLMGSIAKVTWSDLRLFAIPFVLGVVPLLALRWRFNILAFGDEEAESLGVNAAALRLVSIVCATLLTASCVAISGVIGWVGLIMPHVVRFIAGPDNRIVVPLSVILGGAFLIAVDTACRSLMPSEIPLGILTSIIGAPLFFLILLRTQQGGRQ